MRSLFSFTGQIGRLAYAALSLAVFFSQHLLTWSLYAAAGAAPAIKWTFLINPLPSIVRLGANVTPLFFLALAYLVFAGWMLAALAFRRAMDANIGGWVIGFAVIPILQLPLILYLSVMPPRRLEAPLPGDRLFQTPGWSWMPAVQGMIAGMAVTLFAVAVGALIFGAYGYGIFIATPVVIGITTGYLANRKGDVGATRTNQLVVLAAILGGLALVMTALEGAICIILASPLGVVFAIAGGVVGSSLALSGKGSARSTLSSITILPLIFAAERVLPPSESFDTRQTIEIAATPECVWQAIIHMDRIDEPLPLPMRLGVAYPLSGEIVGEGVGATRLGVFSTGTAVEQVTEWEPNRKLAFTVLKDVPGMRELSPYAHVHAPHVSGYFLTTNTSFELRLLPNGHTELIERTAHALRLDPILYWMPMARWVVDLNNARVLAHIRHQAELSSQ
jgi:hypothetical protein